jgi:hypothetical protein
MLKCVCSLSSNPDIRQCSGGNAHLAFLENSRGGFGSLGKKPVVLQRFVACQCESYLR